jgi:hypothetical protein
MLHAFAATLADRLSERFGAERADRGLRTATDEVDGAHADNLVTPPDAFSAENAFVGIKIVGRIGRIRRSLAVASAESLNRPLLDPHIPGYAQKLTAVALAADEALLGMIGNGQFHDRPPDLPDFLRLRANLHSFLRRRGARGRQSPHALDFDDTETACAVGLQVGIMTEGWDVKTGSPDSIQNGKPLRDPHGPTVHGEFDLLQRSPLLRD